MAAGGLHSPLAITANTGYVASYHAISDHYSADMNYFATNGVDSISLHARANGASSGNSGYAYGYTSDFLTQTWDSAPGWMWCFNPETPYF